jgi:hypothetical protein
MKANVSMHGRLRGIWSVSGTAFDFSMTVNTSKAEVRGAGERLAFGVNYLARPFILIVAEQPGSARRTSCTDTPPD